MKKGTKEINRWCPDIRFVRICRANPTKSIIGINASFIDFLNAFFLGGFYGFCKIILFTGPIPKSQIASTE